MLSQNFTGNQIGRVSSFQELISTPFHGEMNAICWDRNLEGDFTEIVKNIELDENMKVIDLEELSSLHLSPQGQLARQIIVNDFESLKTHGAAPILNCIKCYDKDDADFFFPTDVYSYHVDRSPIPTDTFLCTYHGASSELIPNAEAKQKILIPEIRKELEELHEGPDEAFESFLSAYYFDLHYQAQINAQPIRLGLGHIWKLAVDHPESEVLPCIHRAPKEKDGKTRLLLIC